MNTEKGTSALTPNYGHGRSRSAQTTPRDKLHEVIVFCALILLGGILLSVVLIAQVDYFYPFLFYVVVVFFAWQRYFSDDVRTVLVNDSETRSS